MGEAQGPKGGDEADDGAVCRSERRAALIEQLFRQHNQSLVRFLAAKLHSEQEARDVAQEAYVRVLRLDAPEAVSYLRALPQIHGCLRRWPDEGIAQQWHGHRSACSRRCPLSRIIAGGAPADRSREVTGRSDHQYRRKAESAARGAVVAQPQSRSHTGARSRQLALHAARGNPTGRRRTRAAAGSFLTAGRHQAVQERAARALQARSACGLGTSALISATGRPCSRRRPRSGRPAGRRDRPSVASRRSCR